MKTFSTALQSHLDGNLTTLATCIRIERTDGEVFGFSTFDQVLTIDGTDYLPAAGFTPTDIAGADNMDVDNLSVDGVLADGILSSETITEEDLRAGRWDFAAFRVFQVNWADLSQGQKKDRAGHLGEVTSNRLTFVAELLGLMQAYSTSIGEITSPGCRANLGDSRCGVNLAAYTVTGHVDSMLSDYMTINDASRVEADAYFDGGVLTITTGDMAGMRFEIKASILGVLLLHVPLPYDATGEDYTAHAGCIKSRSVCKTRFNNVVNFRGEPFLRGNDALVAVGRHST